MTDWAEDFGFTKLENKLSETDYFPRTIADEMYFHLDMYEGTGDEKYLDRALEYADFASISRILPTAPSSLSILSKWRSALSLRARSIFVLSGISRIALIRVFFCSRVIVVYRPFMYFVIGDLFSLLTL